MQNQSNEPTQHQDEPGFSSLRPGSRSAVLGVVVAVTASLVAAWSAAGSLGLLAHPLRRVLTLVALAVAVVVQRPQASSWSVRVVRWVAILLAVVLVGLPLPPANVLAVGLVLAALAWGVVEPQAEHARRPCGEILLASSAAVAVFGLYRFAVTSIPWLWLAADRVGRGLGDIAGLISGRSVWVGATFAGVDFLVLTTALWGIYLYRTPRPRGARAIYGFLGVLMGHLAYLIVLSYVPDMQTTLPTGDAVGTLKPVFRFLSEALPWNLPVVACALHVLVVAAMLRWSTWMERADRQVERAARRPSLPGDARVLAIAALIVAVVLPIVAVRYPRSLSLSDKKIVFYEKGFLNWLKPTHGSYGRLSSGMYGMLPVFVESLGAECLISAHLSEADLQDADAVVLIFPDEPWEEGQLDRIHAYVRRGGSLLVMGEHTTRDEQGANRFNEALTPAAMQVRFDSATFAVGGWLHSYQAVSHPVTAGVPDDRNQFGVVIGASLDIHWPARPLLMGRWGWTDDGDEANTRAMMGNSRYDPGEKLGDLVLAAEQPLGKGRIVAFGDTSGLSNAINVASYPFNARLFAYLAGGGPRAHPAWRQLVALAMSVLLVVMLLYQPGVVKTCCVVLGLTVSLAACTAATKAGARVLPDGRRQTPNNVAYIDASHVEAYSSESWRPDGIGGLALTLMRNGYLALTLPELTPERLERAGLLVSIAPYRSHSPAEIEAIEAFVHAGGSLIMTVGYERAGPSQPLLDAFGFRLGVPGDDALESAPLGHFKSPYLESQSKRVYVRFHAGWPVASTDPNARAIAYGKDNRPVILMRRFGAGRVVLIGDTGFAMNKNLERENGAAFDGLYENADFWRWLLTLLRGREIWIPPILQSDSSANGAATGEAQP